MKRHTKGRWIYTPDAPYDQVRLGYLVLQDKRTNAANIATIIPCAGMTDEEVESNAKLIAHAPQLLEQQEKLVERLQNGRDYLMGVQSDKLTVEDALEAFGFGRNELGEEI